MISIFKKLLLPAVLPGVELRPRGVVAAVAAAWVAVGWVAVGWVAVGWELIVDCCLLVKITTDGIGQG